MPFRRRALRIILGTLLVYALLVATHLGEFWPFSIYPMFSQAGNPWTRAVVREMPPDTEAVPWDTLAFADLPGAPHPLVPQGINQNDVANYVSKTKTWTPRRQQGLRNLFAKSRQLDQPLLVLKVGSALVGDSVAIQAMPVMFITPDSLALHPDLQPPALASSEATPGGP